jgi:hypothetical protein
MKKRTLTLLLTLFLLYAPSVLAHDGIIHTGCTEPGTIHTGLTEGVMHTGLTDGIIMPCLTNGIISSW